MALQANSGLPKEFPVLNMLIKWFDHAIALSISSPPVLSPHSLLLSSPRPLPHVLSFCPLPLSCGALSPCWPSDISAWSGSPPARRWHVEKGGAERQLSTTVLTVYNRHYSAAGM